MVLKDKKLSDVVASILADNPKTVTYFVSEENSNQQLAVACSIKRLFPRLEVILSGPGLDLAKALKALKQKEADQVVIADSLQDFQSSKKKLWLDEDGQIRSLHSKDRVSGKAKVLLVLMPAWNNDCAPLGLAHISAALKNKEYDVEVFDLNWYFWQNIRREFSDIKKFQDLTTWAKHDLYVEEYRPYMQPTLNRFREKIRSENYAYVGFSIFLTSIEASKDAFAILRKVKPEVKIFCGGPSCLPEWAERVMLAGKIDGAVYGEGENTVVDLLDTWRSGVFKPVSGACLRGESGELLKGKTRPLANINELPVPDFSGFPVYDYDKLIMPIYFSRGCVARCAFCSETQYWVRYRILSADKVVDSMRRIIDQFGIRSFSFNDSLMNGSHKHLEKFVDLIIEANLKVKFHGYGRLDNELTDDLIRKLAASGCVGIAFGMESGSQKVSDLMRKQAPVKFYPRIIKSAHKAGIFTTVCVIVGFPGESWWNFFETLVLLFKLRNHIGNLNASILTLSEDSLLGKDFDQFEIIKQENMGMDWRSKDGKNTPLMRVIRHYILKTVWYWLKNAPTSPQNWAMYKAQLPMVPRFWRKEFEKAGALN